MDDGVDLGELQPFYTATKPLCVWLNQANFRYKVELYRTKYHWTRDQVKRLLDDIVRTPANGHFLMEKEVVILQGVNDQDDEAKQAFIEGMNVPDWTVGKARVVEIIDGQQRITTLLLTYAVLRHRLQQESQALGMAADGSQEDLHQATENAMLRIAKRLHFDDEGEAGTPLVLQRVSDGYALGRWKLSQLNVCDFYLDLQASNEPEQPLEVRSMAYINSWLCTQAAGADNTLQWLLDFKDILDNNIWWTTRLVPHRGRGLQECWNQALANRKISRPLDAIKARLIRHAETADERRRSLDIWMGIEASMHQLAEYLNAESCGKTQLVLLRIFGLAAAEDAHEDEAAADGDDGEETAADGDDEEETAADGDDEEEAAQQPQQHEAGHLITELLRLILAMHRGLHVGAIEANIASSEVDRFVDSPFSGDFCSWSLSKLMWEIASYSSVFTALLTQRRFGNGRHIYQASGSILRTLLSFRSNKSLKLDSWRPLVLLLLKNVPDHQDPGQSLLCRALRQVEFVAFCLQFGLKNGRNRSGVFAHLMRNVSETQQLPELIRNNGLTRCAFDWLKVKNPNRDIRAPVECLLKELYTCDIYGGARKDVPVLLLLESLKSGDSDWLSAGNAAVWTGDTSVEHIVPQGPTELKRPWKWENSEFKKMDSTIHTNLKHKLGNLALVGRRWNSKWGDCLYSDKRSDYAICGCRLLAEVALEHENWTPSTLLLRHNKLIQLLAARWYSVYNKEADSTEAVRNVPWEQWENMLRANAGLPNVCEEREKKIREWWEILEAVVLDINADTAPKQEDYSQRLDSLLASAPPGMTSREVQHLKRIVECLPHSAALSAAGDTSTQTGCEPVMPAAQAAAHMDPAALPANHSPLRH